jgi:kynurenine formamidase
MLTSSARLDSGAASAQTADMTACRIVVVGVVAAVNLAAGPARALVLEDARLVDLTHAFDERTIYWPTARRFELHRVAHGHTEAGYWYAANDFCAAEHGGTHLDAPLHFAEGRWGTAEVPLERLVGPAVVIDVSSRAAEDADALVAVDDVVAFEGAHGRIPDGAIVLLRTGWSSRWGDPVRYLGTAAARDTANLHFPGLGEEAARFLTRERRVDAVGIDTASIDHGPSRGFEAHRVLAAANVVVFENVANLDRVPPSGAWVVALPMKIGGGSGAPLRAMALVP